ncbi:hypothetical protein ACHAPT_004232 [Fusarium lateritium]
MTDRRGKKRRAGEAFANDFKIPPVGRLIYVLDEVAPGGDVIFMLNKGRARVQVISAIMKKASPVFADMLGPKAEQENSLGAASGTPVKIPLSEDDATAFAWICRVLHRQADTSFWSPKPAKLVQVYNLAVKYKLFKGIKLSLRYWLDQQLDKVRFHELWSLSLACQRVHDASSFAAVTRRLMIGHPESFVKLAAQMESDVPGSDARRIVFRLAALLEEARSMRVSKIFNVLRVDLLAALRACRCDCEKDWELEAEYRLALQDYDEVCECECERHRNSNRSIEDAVETVLKILPRSFYGHCCELCAEDRLSEYMRLREASLRLRDDVEGLCLACFDQRDGGKCTTEHRTY